MDTSKPDPVPAEILADLEAVCKQIPAGGVTDPELLRRVRERSEKARAEVLRRHGVLDVAADLIREARDEE
jgi:hypothetical protein